MDLLIKAVLSRISAKRLPLVIKVGKGWLLDGVYQVRVVAEAMQRKDRTAWDFSSRGVLSLL